MQRISRLDQIPEFDSHYVIYADEGVVNGNSAHFRVLSKLVSPISIYTGLQKSQVAELTGQSEGTGSLFAYRKYDDSLIVVNSTLALKETRTVPTERRMEQEMHI